MADHPLCVKTPKGIDEMERRAHGLPLRARQVLIMIDGRRDFDALSLMFHGDGLAAILTRLLDEGYVVPLAPPAKSAKSRAPWDDAAPKAPSPRDDAERFALARNFMLNTLSAFVGLAGSSLATRVESCGDLDSLRQHFHAWRDAIGLSSDGRKRLGELETKLAALLS